jgi:hypothetical protein
VVADKLVAWIQRGSSCITDPGSNHTIKLPKLGIRAPESS